MARPDDYVGGWCTDCEEEGADPRHSHGKNFCNKHRIRRWRQTPAGKASQRRSEKKYDTSEKGIARRKTYQKSEKGKKAVKRYQETEKGKEAVTRAKNKQRMKRSPFARALLDAQTGGTNED